MREQLAATLALDDVAATLLNGARPRALVEESGEADVGYQPAERASHPEPWTSKPSKAS